MPHHFPLSERSTSIHATLIDCPAPGTLRIRHNQALAISPTTGCITSISSSTSTTTTTTDRIIIPGLIDTHLHAPQYPQLATKTDLPLIKWLKDYTFPAETAFSNPEHARKVYPRLVQRLLRNGTTGVALYASNHLEATQILAETCAEHGLRAAVGKTASDQFLPGDYVETTEGSLRDTERFIEWCHQKWGRGGIVTPVVTPRFVPTCSEKLLMGLGEIAGRYGVRVQTHAAESLDQVAWVQSLWPQERRDIKVLKKCGLLREGTLLAHACHLHDAEVKEMMEAGAAIACCPVSNMLFARAVLPIQRFRKLGVKIGLGTDVAGGHSPSMLTAIRTAGLASRVFGFAMPDEREEVPEDVQDTTKGDEEIVDWKTAFWLATRGGGMAMGWKTGMFEVGMKWDAVEVDVRWDEEEEDVELGLERWVVGHGSEEGVKSVWIDGKQVYRRS